MSRRKWVWFAAMAMLTLMVTVSSPAFPADQDAIPTDSNDATEPDSSTVERILQEQEQMITGTRFSYEPAGRRDPFRSLFESQRIDTKARPAGIRGMLVSEIDLTGIVRDAVKGDTAMVLGTDNKGYFLRVGDRVYDGTVISVDADRGIVTFRQKVNDPKIIKGYRDVAKRLKPLGDEE